MSVNKHMHPRNIYRTPPNFKQLAIDYPEFRKYVKQDITGKIQIDFKTNEALRALSKTLLKKDFDLDVNIPLIKLIPTIPLRLNYILWLEDLLSILPQEMKPEEVVGVDIGTGASCIYPLLAAKKNQWKMVATELDIESVNLAQENVNRNNLQDYICVKQGKEESLLKDVVENDRIYTFCMCNPPFFASPEELIPKRKARLETRPEPRNAKTGSTHEVVVQGGEVKFITRLINESVDLKSQFLVFTTMVGIKSNLPPVKKLLREKEVKSFKETIFCQGHTTRWGLAWTFQDLDLRKIPSYKASDKKKDSQPVIYKIPETENLKTLKLIVSKVRELLQTLQMEYEEIKNLSDVVAFRATAKENTWSHQRRKRREMMRQQNMNGSKKHDLDTSGSSSKGDKSCDSSMEVDQSTHETKSKSINLGEHNNDHPLQEKTPQKTLNDSEKHELDTSGSSKDDEKSIEADQKNFSQEMHHKRTRSESSDDEEGYFYSKKCKVYDGPQTAFLKFDLFLRQSSGEHHLAMAWVEGTAPKDALFQVMQYFKNNLK